MRWEWLGEARAQAASSGGWLAWSGRSYGSLAVKWRGILEWRLAEGQKEGWKGRKGLGELPAGSRDGGAANSQ